MSIMSWSGIIYLSLSRSRQATSREKRGRERERERTRKEKKRGGFIQLKCSDTSENTPALKRHNIASFGLIIYLAIYGLAFWPDHDYPPHD